jgi:hypothetical protein
MAGAPAAKDVTRTQSGVSGVEPEIPQGAHTDAPMLRETCRKGNSSILKTY